MEALLLPFLDGLALPYTDIEETISEKKSESKYDPTLKFKEHYLSHYPEDIRNLAPLVLTNTDLFESVHNPYKNIRRTKRTSKNVLYTLISHNEQLSVYHATGKMITSQVEKSIKHVCNDDIVKEYLQNFNGPRPEEVT